MYSLALLIFVVIFSISYVNGIGTANIMNKCDFEVFIWIVVNITNNTINILVFSDGFYSEGYRLNPNGEEISLKIIIISVDIVII
jgi:hypothetical protein